MSKADTASGVEERMVMAWSTHQIAGLAGTTVNTVRHYHRTGLLDEPPKMPNGYKQYGPRHLVRLLQIRRLRDLGVPVGQIEAFGTREDSPEAALFVVDADLSASIDRLQRARAEIRAVLTGSSITDVPPGFEDVALHLSGPDRALLLVYAQLYDDSVLSDLKLVIQSGTGGVAAGVQKAVDALAADADGEARQRLAEMLAPIVAQHMIDHPWMTDRAEHLSRSSRVTGETSVETVIALYNAAQLDVLGRAAELARQHVESVR